MCSLVAGGYKYLGSSLLPTQFCDGVSDCKNTNVDERRCPDVEFAVMRTGKRMRKDFLCNDVCEDIDNLCEDEAECKGFLYGMYCHRKIGNSPFPDNKLSYLPPYLMCNANGYESCFNGKDGSRCKITNETEPTCLISNFDNSILREVSLAKITRCSAVQLYINTKKYSEKDDAHSYCDNFIDQTNCSDVSKVGVICNINTFISTVSKHVVCKNYSRLCDDDMENLCTPSSPYCYIHKHRYCDGVKDCPDNSDEIAALCSSLTIQTCTRRANTGSHRIPLTWLSDGIEDCLDGKDETGNWPTCGRGVTKRFVTKNNTCDDVFLCPDGSTGFVEYQHLCDGVESCGSENSVCKISRVFPEIYTITSTYDAQKITKHLLYCLKGLQNILYLKNVFCVATFFRFPKHEIFGISEFAKKLVLPSTKISCDHMFGETYLYMSCTNTCTDSNCPLTRYPKFDSCQDQFPQKLGTFANNNEHAYLTFLIKSRNSNHNNYFVCESVKKCLPYAKVCDLVDDCGDRSDEANCTNHFICANPIRFILKTQKCDGKFDCLDFSDECNEICSKQILNGILLKTVSWVFGVLAVTFNTISIARSSSKISNCKNTRALNDKCMILLVSIGDLLVGLYLLAVSSFDAYYKESYCTLQAEWLTGSSCSILGMIITAGSLISVFSMTSLSVARFIGINNGMIASPSPNKCHVLKILSYCLSIVGFSIFLSVLPLLTIVEDLFVNGLNYEPALKLFIGFPNKMKHGNIIQAYYGRMKTRPMSWRVIQGMVSEMYSRDYTGLSNKVKTLDFFGNDGVCMFKFFVTSSDPQKYFVWGNLAIYLFCFFAITVLYLLIAAISRKSSASLGKKFLKRDIPLQRKIKFLIASDCMCWIPFILVCALHFFETVDATKWYSLFSMVILPINSVINPLLYDSALFRRTKKSLKLKRKLTLIKPRKVGESGEKLELHNLDTFASSTGLKQGHKHAKPRS